MNYRRRNDPIVIPYPYLTDTTDLTIDGIPNKYISLPANPTLGQWYKPTQNTAVTIPVGKSLLVVRTQQGTTGQILLWDTAASGTAPTRNVFTTDYILFYDGTEIPLAIAGFRTLYLGDALAGPNDTYIRFPSNITFYFTPAN